MDWAELSAASDSERLTRSNKQRYCSKNDSILNTGIWVGRSSESCDIASSLDRELLEPPRFNSAAYTSIKRLDEFSDPLASSAFLAEGILVPRVSDRRGSEIDSVAARPDFRESDVIIFRVLDGSDGGCCAEDADLVPCCR